MKRFAFTRRLGASAALLICLALTSPVLLRAQAPVNMQRINGMVDLSTAPATLTLAGVASHLGSFTGKGQVVLRPGVELGTAVGVGPVILRAANGDLLVGNMTWTVSAAALDGSQRANILFRWADSITLHDGTVVSNTGRFITHRPSGLDIEVVTRRVAEVLIVISRVFTNPAVLGR